MSNQHDLDEIERLRRFESSVLDILDQSYYFQWRKSLLEALDRLEESRNEETLSN